VDSGAGVVVPAPWIASLQYSLQTHRTNVAAVKMRLVVYIGDAWTAGVLWYMAEVPLALGKEGRSEFERLIDEEGRIMWKN